MKPFFSRVLSGSLTAVLLVVVTYDHAFRNNDPVTGKVIDVRGVVLRDEAGRETATLTNTDWGPALILFDKAGKQLLQIAMSEADEPFVMLNGSNEKSRVALIARRSGDSLISIFGPGGRELFLVQTLPDDSVSEFFLDKDGKRRIMSRVDSNGLATNTVFGGKGEPGHRFGVTSDGNVFQNLYDIEGKARLGLVVDSAGAARIQLHDSAGTARAGLRLLADGGRVEQTLWDSSGKPRVGMFIEKSDGPRLQLSYPKGANAIDMFVDKKGRTAVILGDEFGQRHVGINMDHEGVPSFIVPE